MTSSRHIAAERQHDSLREVIIATAAEMTAQMGWAKVTMSAVAEQVGVSRQTIYNEVTSRSHLAEAMVMQELGRFLLAVESAFETHQPDAGQCIHAATEAVLEFGEANALLRAIVSPDHGSNTELLPLLTTRGAGLIEMATIVVSRGLGRCSVGLVGPERERAADVIVRTVLSHLMEPRCTKAQVAEQMAWLISRMGQSERPSA